MKLPYPKHLDTTPIVVNLTDGLTEEGEQNEVSTYTGFCNLSEHTKTVLDANGQKVQLEATALIGEDIGPTLKTITGNVILNGKKYKIFKSARPRNPDGSVHHTKLELM
ncbi:MAG: hypothetical protein N3B21_19315 [Clostridia bacterium]|nr:hypothetical protein [Clostridia bacterium]